MAFAVIVAPVIVVLLNDEGAQFATRILTSRRVHFMMSGAADNVLPTAVTASQVWRTTPADYMADTGRDRQPAAQCQAVLRPSQGAFQKSERREEVKVELN